MSSFVFKILSIIISCITSLSIAAAPMTYAIAKSNMEVASSFDSVAYDNQLAPEKDTDGNWTFTTDGEFKVLQLTDVHLGGGFLSIKKDKMSLNAVAALITAEKPDLVIATGDIAYPVPFQAGTFNNEVPAKMFIDLMETLGVYWTVTFGNHDSELYSDYERGEVSDLYSNPDLKYCLFQAGPDDVDGYGNQIIKVKNTSGIVTQAFFVIDSHDYTDGDYLGIQWKYDNIHDNQIEWYRNSVLAIDAANDAVAGYDYPMFNSLAFFHIPLEEYSIAWGEYKDNDHQNTDDVTYFYGRAGEKDEKVYCGIYPDQFFETMQELGSTKGCFCGHDHYNNFSVDYKGIRLTYGMSIDYLAYSGISKEGSQRGCTVITVNPDGTFDCVAENYYQDKYVSKYDKESVTMQWD